MPTPALRYRRKASAIGAQATAEADIEKELALLHHALSYIQLAENEELLENAPGPAISTRTQ